jgi:hypothetical protein
MLTRTTAAVTTPPVPGDQVFGKPMSGWICGATRCARQAFERPAAPEVPVLSMHVRETPLRHLLHRPRARVVHRGRPGQPRSVAVGEPEERLHRLRAVESFVADLRDGGVIGLLGLRDRQRRESDDEENEDGALRIMRRILPGFCGRLTTSTFHVIIRAT